MDLTLGTKQVSPIQLQQSWKYVKYCCMMQHNGSAQLDLKGLKCIIKEKSKSNDVALNTPSALYHVVYDDSLCNSCSELLHMKLIRTDIHLLTFTCQIHRLVFLGKQHDTVLTKHMN